jgi:hypothetical protein
MHEVTYLHQNMTEFLTKNVLRFAFIADVEEDGGVANPRATGRPLKKAADVFSIRHTD